MSDRYTGRHIHQGRHVRQARHGAWLTKKRARSGQQALVPTAAALTVAGLLVGGTGAALQLNASNRNAPVGIASMVDAEAFPPDRDAQADRASRDDARLDGPSDSGEVAPASATEDATEAATAAIISSGSCDASYYDGRRATASGEQFDSTDLTAGHRSLPFDTQVRVINAATGESVIVRINDRGPYRDDRCLNLSEAAFDTIADLGAGVVDVRYEVLAQDAT